MSKPLWDRFQKDIYGQGIKVGGQKDLDFFNRHVLPYYMSNKWLTKDPPKGWGKDKNKIIAKCHKNTYDYCKAEVQKKVGDCIKGMLGSLMLKYGATAMAYCPILDKKIQNYEKNDKPQAMKFFTEYCEMHGKTC